MPANMLEKIAAFANGDARVALSTLEMVVLNGEMDADGRTSITDDALEQCISKKSLLYDKGGEAALQECYDPSFAHYKQSLRVVEKLEKNGRGLNLTWEVRDGIVNHTGEMLASTLEGVVVKLADRIAYINHDIDDACRAGILSVDDIPRDILDVLGRKHSERINRMVTSVIDESLDKPYIRMGEEVGEATANLRDFLFDRVYRSPIAKGEDTKARELLIKLFEYYVKNPEKMPQQYYKNIENEPVERCVCDFVSGMTDRYAIETYNSLFVPNIWRGKC